MTHWVKPAAQVFVRRTEFTDSWPSAAHVCPCPTGWINGCSGVGTRLFGPACEREREERKKKSLRPSPPRTAGPGRHNRAGSSVRFLRLSQKATRYYFDVVFHYAPHLTRSTLTGVTHTHTHTHTHTLSRGLCSLFQLSSVFLTQFLASFVFSQAHWHTCLVKAL